MIFLSTVNERLEPLDLCHVAVQVSLGEHTFGSDAARIPSCRTTAGHDENFLILDLEDLPTE
jgi:hypothetical protein